MSFDDIKNVFSLLDYNDKDELNFYKFCLLHDTNSLKTLYRDLMNPPIATENNDKQGQKPPLHPSKQMN